MFLDAIGERRGSPRRGSLSGLETSYLLPTSNGRSLQLILLDERWYRDPLPCHMRRSWCEGILAAKPGEQDPNAVVFCSDFLNNDGSLGIGSCCSRDERLAAYCEKHEGQVKDPVQRGLWPIACEPTNARMWGMEPIAGAHVLNRSVCL